MPPKRRLLLINPRQQHRHYATQPEMCRLMGRRAVISPLSLATVAALTPDTYDVRIADEQLAPLPAHFRPDLVGITSLTNTAARCYEIADRYRAMGVPVVLGGPHATFMVQEALQHADSVVVGEAEGAWERCLADLERGSLQRTYEAAERTAFRCAPAPRWDLVDTRRVLSIPVQTSRGCPYNCEFCAITKLFGRKIRHRGIDDVVAEIVSLPLKNIMFVDDNLTKDHGYALELMRRLRPLGVSWSCQASIDLAEDEHLLAEMSAAGCQHILIGLESLNPPSLVDGRKYHNRVSEYETAIGRVHAAGMMVFASFLVGFDHDTLAEVDHIREFALKVHLPYVILCPLAAPPGCDLHARMVAEGRWLGWLDGRYTGVISAFRYANFTQEQLLDKLEQTLQVLYAAPDIQARVVGLLGEGHFAGRKRGREYSPVLRLWMLLKMAAIYLLSRDRARQGLFLEVMRLVAAGRSSMDIAMGLLIAMEGFRRHVRRLGRT